MKYSVVTYLLKNNKVYLGQKKLGYSKGKWNGFGGKIENRESPKQAAVREVAEESEVVVKTKDLKKVAHFYYHEPQGDWDVVVFICKKFEGVPKESEEMLPDWFETDNLPLADMWENDALWLKRILVNKECLKGTFWHDKKGNVIKHELTKVETF